MRMHYKKQAESDLGVGIAYIEIKDGWPTRQVEIYGSVWRWGDETHPEWLADQPFDVLELGEEDAISAEEFENIWKESLKRCQPIS